MTQDARLREAADRSEIAQVLYKLARGLDRLEPETLRAVFADDAHVELGVFHAGDADGFVKVAMDFMGSMERTQHTIGNILVELSGDVAAAESHVHAHHVLRTDEGPQELVVGARYLTRLRRGGEGWHISHHTEVMDWGVMRPLGPWFDDNRELPKGARKSDDLSATLFGDAR